MTAVYFFILVTPYLMYLTPPVPRKKQKSTGEEKPCSVQTTEHTLHYIGMFVTRNHFQVDGPHLSLSQFTYK